MLYYRASARSDASRIAWLLRKDPNRLLPAPSRRRLTYTLPPHRSDAMGGGSRKTRIAKSTFATHCSDIIKVGSYVVSMVETFAHVLVFAHGPYFIAP
jgi:hypothetical protein